MTRGSGERLSIAFAVTNAISVGAGWGHSCALLKDGSVRCWGLNYNGQLGNGTTADSHVPTTVAGW
jgi:alpha-tubulin suppressor-like RCC1 family protein